MLETYRHWARAEGAEMKNHSRLLKVRQSMARVKSVLHEREIAYLTYVDPMHNRARQLKQARSRRLRALKQIIKNPPKIQHKFDIRSFHSHFRVIFIVILCADDCLRSRHSHFIVIS